MTSAPRIAVVDDELIVAKDLEASLRKFGYDVSGVAPSGVEAVSLAGATKPDLMLMDIRLRGEMDGIEAARRIQHEFDVPVVYVTAFTDEDTLTRARDTYPYGYLVKPVQEGALRSTIATALHRHRAERQARKSLARQRALCDALGHLLWTARGDGRADSFNRRWFDYTGLTHTASRGFGWITALHPTDMRQCLSLWKEAVQQRQGFELVCSVKQAGNKFYRRHLMRVVLMSEAPVGPQWLATLTDIHDYELRPEASRLAEAGIPSASVAPVGAVADQPAPEANGQPALQTPAATRTDSSSHPTASAPPHASQPAPSGNFRDWFCAASKCQPDEFADRVFLLSLYLHVLPVAVIFWPFRKRIFAEDYALIERTATARWGGDIPWHIGRLRTPEWVGGLARRLLRCRISTRRLGTLVGKMMNGAAAQ